MSGLIKIKIPELHVGQASIKAERERYNIVCCGRRYGKNVLLTELVIDTAIEDAKPAAWFAPTYKMLTEDWRNLRSTLAPALSGVSEQEKQLRLVTGGVIDMWSLENPDSARGRRYKRVVVNEAGLVPNLIDVVNLVIRPMLVDFRGDIWLAGTPKGMNGFYQLFNTDGWKTWQRSSYDNPFIPSDELDKLRDVLTENAFEQEIMAAFLADGAGVFRGIREAATATRQTHAVPGHEYVMGLDLARKVDYTVMVVLDVSVTPYEVVFMDRFNDVDWQTQINRIKAVVDRFQVGEIVADQTGVGDPIVEQLQSELY